MQPTSTAAVFRCHCGHMLYEHSARRMESQSGLTYTRCRACQCPRFLTPDGQDFYDGSLRKLAA